MYYQMWQLASYIVKVCLQVYVQVYIYHFVTLDQREKSVDKSHIAHQSVRYKKYWYKKYRTLSVRYKAKYHQIYLMKFVKGSLYL